MTLGELNALDGPSAERALLRCCGSTAWAARMASARPFASLDALQRMGDDVWRTLTPSDWLEAFAAHPRIGATVKAGRAAGDDTGTERWSAEEQALVARESADVHARLADANRAYEQRFGYTFNICATGRTAAQILDAARARLGNNPDDELRAAAEEQRRISRLRLEKLIA